MLLESAKVCNYKSIGKENNVLYVENSVTALIGKNESGKSNVLESLGLLNLWNPLDANYLRKLTRGQEEQPTVSLVFSFSEQDRLTFPGATGATTLRYSGTEVTMDGGLSSMISQDVELNSCVALLTDAAKTNSLKLDGSRISSLRARTAKLASISQKVYSTIFNELEGAKGDIRVAGVEIKTELLEITDRISAIIRRYYNLIPQVYYRKGDTVLKDSYSFEEIKKIYEENKNPATSNNIFFNMMNAAGVDKETLFGAFEAITEAAQHTNKKRIIPKINALVKEFNNFYSQEEISLDFDIVSKAAKLYISTADMYMNFSERSNGLKWYFSLFVDVMAKTSSERPILYLLDEPGVYLHVKAQKQLLALFGNLCRNGNQVIYTTHSPFMIDSNNVFNVRAVEKDANGLTNIFRSIYNHKLSRASKLETLTPLIQAFGMDLKDNIGPQYEKVNIVVEGVTDCMYLTAMLKYFNIDHEKKPNIIPCVGVDSVHLLVSILIGWGCEYKVVVDYDTQGYNQYKKITSKSGLTETTNVFFVNCKSASSEQDVKGINKATTESLIAEDDNNKLVNKYDGTNDTKTLAAKEFMDKIISGEITITEVTANNFKRLFVALGIMAE